MTQNKINQLSSAGLMSKLCEFCHAHKNPRFLLGFNRKEVPGQGAIEYLLVLGAAIIVVAIVVILISGVTGSVPDSGNEVDNAYSGIQDIYDRATNSATVILKLRAGNNDIEFQSLKTAQTVDELFGDLQTNTTLEIANCIGGATITKTSTGWNPTEAATCPVPLNTNIKIYSPSDEDLEVKTEIEQEPIYLISDEATLISAIDEDPDGHYRLTQDITIPNSPIGLFTGILDGDGKKLNISQTNVEFITNLNNAELRNILIDSDDATDIRTNQGIIINCNNSIINANFQNQIITYNSEQEFCLDSKENCLILNNNNCEIN